MIKRNYINPRHHSHADMDSVRARKQKLGIDRDSMDLTLLQKCETLWNNLSEFREKRARAMRFCYGDQWSDYIEINGEYMTQRDYITRQGNVALQSNQIATMVNSITGVLVKEQNEPICIARDRNEQQYGEVVTVGLQANCDKNKMNVLYINAVGEVILGGLAIMRESYERRFGRLDSWTDIVSPNYFFFESTMQDPRFWDASLMGQIHDVTFNKLCEKFAKSEDDFDILCDIYTTQSHILGGIDAEDITTRQDTSRLNFRTPPDKNLCRVYEIWTKEARPRIRLHDTSEGTLSKINADDTKARGVVARINKERKEVAKRMGKIDPSLIKTEFYIDTYWYCRFLAPDGSILWEGESDYPDKSHPYSVCATPFTDGRIVGYINPAIDHNLAINRALTLQDWVTRTQVKGITMVPEALIPDDMTREEFAEQWTSIDGLIFYEPKPGVPEPKVFHGTAVNFDAAKLVQMYKSLMDDSTSVSDALQGKTPLSGTSASLYAQQTANSSTPIASLLAKFHSFMDDIAAKKMKNLVAFYDTARWESIAGSIESLFQNPNLHLNEIRHLEFDLSVIESTDTPAYRAVSDDILMQFFTQGAITLEDLLQFGSFPFADKLLQKVQARNIEMQAAQGGGQIPIE